MFPSLRTFATRTTSRAFSSSPAAMGVDIKRLSPGSGTEKPVEGQRVTIEYTGWIKDATKPDNKGAQFDSSVGRGDFVTEIGVGKVIKGWDEGVTQMTKGEKVLLDISSDYGYGDRGFPGAIPPKADLLFEVELKDFK